jgi:hypothetical protein
MISNIFADCGCAGYECGLNDCIKCSIRKVRVLASTEKFSDVDFDNTDGMLESSMPLLRRNLRRRHRTLEAKESMSKASDWTANATRVEVAQMKNAPFLKRNLCIEHQGKLLPIRRRAGATKKESTTRTNIRSQYRVHFITYESSDCDEMKKNMMMHSFLCPAYQCPFHCPYKVVSTIKNFHESSLIMCPHSKLLTSLRR